MQYSNRHKALGNCELLRLCWRGIRSLPGYPADAQRVQVIRRAGEERWPSGMSELGLEGEKAV